MVGNVVALIGVALHQITGSAVPDAIASLAIGLLLGMVGIALAERNRDFLIGEAAPSQVRAAVQTAIRSQAGIGVVHEVIVVFSGPVAASVIAHVGVDPALDGRDVEELIDRTSDAVQAAVPIIDRAEIVPTTGHRLDRAERRGTPQGTHAADGIHRLPTPARTTS